MPSGTLYRVALVEQTFRRTYNLRIQASLVIDSTAVLINLSIDGYYLWLKNVVFWDAFIAAFWDLYCVSLVRTDVSENISSSSSEFRTMIRFLYVKQKTNKQTPWPLVRERTIPTERPRFLYVTKQKSDLGLLFYLM
jgi:hypothetical protein